MRRLLRVELQEIGVEAAVAVERRAPLAVLRELDALRDHEVEEVVADGVEFRQRAAIDGVQPPEEFAVGFEVARLVRGQHRREAVVEVVHAVVRRRQRVFAPGQARSSANNRSSSALASAAPAECIADRPSRIIRNRAHRFMANSPDPRIGPAQCPEKTVRDQWVSRVDKVNLSPHSPGRLLYSELIPLRLRWQPHPTARPLPFTHPKT